MWVDCFHFVNVGIVYEANVCRECERNWNIISFQNRHVQFRILGQYELCGQMRM